MSVWSLVYKGFEPGEEGLREALCTLGNGYFATRGAGSESEADKIHYPGTYLAGGYNRLCTNLAGHEIENEDLVNLPNWLPLNFRIPGETWFNLMGVEILEYRQELDLRHGILFRAVYFQDHRGRRSRLTCRRLVHMAEPHSAAQEFMLVPENWSGEIEIISALDGRVVNAGVERYKELNGKHLDPVKSEVIDGETIYLEVMTNQSKIRIAEAARTRIFSDAEQMEFDGDSIEEPLYACRCFRAEVAKDRPLKAEKIVALFTSRDPAISEPGLEARKAVKRAKGFEDLYNSHALAWKHIWRRFDVDLDQSDPEEADRTETIIHLYTFHLLQTVSIQTTMAMDLDVGVPARGWHGEAYRGHILWDELFVFPIFNLRVPEITKELLLYRYRRLEEARVAARNKGYKGAMYPWQSGSNGREESQAIHLNPRSGRWIPDNSRLQRHVNSAIVYNAWQYFQVTGDTEFMYFFGAEMILEIARFWASKAAYNQDLGRYEIKGVMGPDEYHEGYPGAEEPGLNNNAYTNITAVWVLTRALGILESVLPEDRRRELRETLDLREEEIERWREISRKMFIPFHDEGIISQFDGYGRLEEFDWEGYRNKYGDIQRLDRILEAEGDTPNRYKASKQADVLMLFFLFSAEELRELFDRLGYRFEYETIPNNIEYYIRRTSHGSTLSRVVHSWVLIRSDRRRSWNLFKEALQSDVSDIQGGTTPEGIHLGAMAGTLDLLKRGYLGIEPREDVLRFNPLLPEELKCVTMQIRYRGHSLQVMATSRDLTVKALESSERPIKIGFKEEIHELEQGTTWTRPL